MTTLANDNAQNPSSIEAIRIRVALLQSKLLQALSGAILADLAGRVTIQRFGAKTTIVRKGDPGNALYIIITGRVNVGIVGESGREVTLSVLRPGDSFGEMSLFDRKPRSAHCTTTEATEVLMLSQSELAKHMQRFPETAMNILAELGKRLRRADETIAQLALCDVSERLAHKLVALAGDDGSPVEEGVLVKRRPTQQELANMVGSCRETISRMFNQLIRDGMVITRGRSMILTEALLSTHRVAA